MNIFETNNQVNNDNCEVELAYTKTSKLEELLEKFEITAEEEQIFRKVQERYYLEDLYSYIEEHKDNYTKKQLQTIIDNARIIVQRYSEHLGEDWWDTMDSAIDYVLY